MSTPLTDPDRAGIDAVLLEYGAAIFSAQGVERALINLLFLTRLPNTRRTRDSLERLIQQLERQPMGKVFESVLREARVNGSAPA